MTVRFPHQSALRLWLQDVFHIYPSSLPGFHDKIVRVSMVKLGARLTRSALDLSKAFGEEYSRVPRRGVRAMETLIVAHPFSPITRSTWAFTEPSSWARRRTFQHAVSAAYQFRAMALAMTNAHARDTGAYHAALDNLYNLILHTGQALTPPDKECSHECGARLGLALAKAALRDIERHTPAAEGWA